MKTLEEALLPCYEQELAAATGMEELKDFFLSLHNGHPQRIQAALRIIEEADHYSNCSWLLHHTGESSVRAAFEAKRKGSLSRDLENATTLHDYSRIIEFAGAGSPIAIKAMEGYTRIILERLGLVTTLDECLSLLDSIPCIQAFLSYREVVISKRREIFERLLQEAETIKECLDLRNKTTPGQQPDAYDMVQARILELTKQPAATFADCLKAVGQCKNNHSSYLPLVEQLLELATTSQEYWLVVNRLQPTKRTQAQSSEVQNVRNELRERAFSRILDSAENFEDIRRIFGADRTGIDVLEKAFSLAVSRADFTDLLSGATEEDLRQSIRDKITELDLVELESASSIYACWKIYNRSTDPIVRYTVHRKIERHLGEKLKHTRDKEGLMRILEMCPQQSSTRLACLAKLAGIA